MLFGEVSDKITKKRKGTVNPEAKGASSAGRRGEWMRSARGARGAPQVLAALKLGSGDIGACSLHLTFSKQASVSCPIIN